MNTHNYQQVLGQLIGTSIVYARVAMLEKSSYRVNSIFLSSFTSLHYLTLELGCDCFAVGILSSYYHHWTYRARKPRLLPEKKQHSQCGALLQASLLW